MKHHGGSVIGVVVAIGIAIPALIVMFYGLRAAIFLLFGSKSDRNGRAKQSSPVFLQASNRPVMAEGEDEIRPTYGTNVVSSDRIAS